VRAPYDGYVHDATRFWNASGLSIKLAGAGLQIQVESLKALILGGIAFDTPDRAAHGQPISAENHVFPLFADRDTAQGASYTRKIEVVSYFPGSVSGLGPGSPVTMHGLTVGHVTDVRLVYDKEKDAVLAPVRYEVEPERVVGVGTQIYKSEAEAMDGLLKRGLRATLQSASLITGQQQVALDFLPDEPAVKVTEEDGAFVLPTAPGGGFAGLQAAANALLDKVNTIPFDQIGRNLDGILKSVNALASGPEARETLAKLAGTIATTEQVMKHVDSGTAPALKRLPEMTNELHKTVANANKLLVSLDAGYGDNTKFNRDLERLMVQLNDAVTSMRSLADLLARHPEALIKGRPKGGVE
jgi:paraquat-inducible protein B